jgi:hypothetical protein
VVLACYLAYAALFCLAATVIFPVVDRGQDLAGLASRIGADTRDEPLALLDPDETTLAIIDHRAGRPFAVIRGREPAAVASWFSTRGPHARLLVLLPGHATGDLSRFVSRWRPVSAPGDGTAAALVEGGHAVLVRRYELPQGRRYALLGPPGSSATQPE